MIFKIDQIFRIASFYTLMYQPLRPRCHTLCICRLDAIGAIGIARCFTYGGAKTRVLHDPAVLPSAALTQEEYTDSRREQTTINHCEYKLGRVPC